MKRRLFQKFRKTLRQEAPEFARLAEIEFRRSTLTARQKEVYDRLVRQLDLHDAAVQPGRCQRIVVPADAAPSDAEKALRLIRVEFDSSWKYVITWEGQGGRTMTMAGRHAGKGRCQKR